MLLDDMKSMLDTFKATGGTARPVFIAGIWMRDYILRLSDDAFVVPTLSKPHNPYIAMFYGVPVAVSSKVPSERIYLMSADQADRILTDED